MSSPLYVKRYSSFLNNFFVNMPYPDIDKISKKDHNFNEEKKQGVNK